MVATEEVAAAGVGMAGLGPEIDAARGLGPQLADQEDLPATDPWRDADLLVETDHEDVTETDPEAETGIHPGVGTEMYPGEEIEMDPRVAPETGRDLGIEVHPEKGRVLIEKERSLDLGQDHNNLVLMFPALNPRFD